MEGALVITCYVGLTGCMQPTRVPTLVPISVAKDLFLARFL